MDFSVCAHFPFFGFLRPNRNQAADDWLQEDNWPQEVERKKKETRLKSKQFHIAKKPNLARAHGVSEEEATLEEEEEQAVPNTTDSAVPTRKLRPKAVNFCRPRNHRNVRNTAATGC